MYYLEIEEEILNNIIFQLREKDLIQLSNELIDAIDTDYEPDRYVESEDYETDTDEDIQYSIDDEGFHYLD
jgi:hypothetical protein